MFLRRQDLIDQFASNFRETDDGELVFQPGKARVGLPISWDEYHALMAEFERVQIVDMAMSWAFLIGAMCVGYYYVLWQNRYLPFFIALGVACVLTFMLHLRDRLGLLLPVIKAREELEKSLAQTGQLPGL